MLFGDMVREMLSITGLKGGHLARSLGYDVSYISRWLNNSKLPSMKNNNELFEQIAKFISDNCDEKSRTAIRSRFDLTKTDSEISESLEREIAVLLHEAYESQQESFANLLAVQSIERNCVLSRFAEQKFRLPTLLCADYAGDSGDDSIEVLSSMTEDVFKGNESLLQSVRASFESKNKKVRIRQLVDFDVVGQNPDVFCRSVIKNITDPKCENLEYYEASNKGFDSSEMMVIRNRVMLRQFSDPYTKWKYSLVTKDPAIVQEFFYGMESAILNKELLIERISTEELSGSNYFLNYMMQGGFRHILTVMHPLYMEYESMNEIWNPKLQGGEKSSYFRVSMFRVPKSVVIFKTAILRYIYEGDICGVGGQMTKFSIPERIRHLTDLIARLKEPNNKFKLTIIEDVNPVLSYFPEIPSVYLSSRTAHATSYSGQGVSFLFKNQKMIQLFREYHAHLESLPETYVITGQQVVEFLSNGVAFLSSQNEINR